jgi:CheY-like chemotaxis protein
MRVLVVDDDRPVVDTLCGIIQELGHEAVGVTDGVAALDSFRRARYDLVVVDLMMPRLTGLEVLRRLRTINRDARLVALTGALPELGELLQAEGIPLVLKPIITAAEVRTLIGSA